MAATKTTAKSINAPTEAQIAAAAVAVARALINNPVLLIGDEPTGNLDSRSGAEILDLFHEIHQQGATIILVTHDPKIAAHTQRIIELADGLIEKITGNSAEDQWKRKVPA